jgi:hypothetical protein
VPDPHFLMVVDRIGAIQSSYTLVWRSPAHTPGRNKPLRSCHPKCRRASALPRTVKSPSRTNRWDRSHNHHQKISPPEHHLRLVDSFEADSMDMSPGMTAKKRAARQLSEGSFTEVQRSLS